MRHPHLIERWNLVMEGMEENTVYIEDTNQATFPPVGGPGPMTIVPMLNEGATTGLEGLYGSHGSLPCGLQNRPSPGDVQYRATAVNGLGGSACPN